MHPELADILVAPAGGGSLTLEGDTDRGEVLSGALVSADGSRYEIREGVPRMVPERDSSVTVDEGATQRSFGAKWAQYDDHEKDQLSRFQYRWFDERFGFRDETAFAEFLASKQRILDAGTGPGL